MGKIGLFDLEKHFAFYGAYHSNPTNVATHMLLVWPILFTALLILYFTPSLFNLPPIEFSILGSNFALVLNFGFLLAIIYSVSYICLEPKAGSLAALLSMPYWVTSSFLASFLGFSLAWKALQNLFQYEPYPGFHATVQPKIEDNISAWQEKKQKLIS